MKVKFKVWAQVEKITVDGETEDYEDVGEPHCIGEFKTEASANAFVDTLTDYVSEEVAE